MNRAFLWMFLLVLSVVSCTQKTATAEHTATEGELTALSHTLYSDKTELFVEFSPLIKGETSKFATHLTVLGENFLPLTEGTVTVSLITGKNGIRNTATAPSSPGIYRLALQPEVAGMGRLIFDIKTPAYTDQIVIDNVKIYADRKAALQDQKPEEGGGEITYLKEQAWKTEFANTEVKAGNFSQIIRTSGMITSSPDDEGIVTAKTDGIVKFTNRNFTIGTPVSAGSVMFMISGGNVAQGNIDASIAQARANLSEAKINYDRARILVADRIIPEKDYLAAKVRYENARTQVGMLTKNYTASGQRNTSPITGFIKSINVAEGQFVTAGTPLAIISKNRSVLLQANIAQKDFGMIPQIISANFKTAGSDTIYSTQDFGGRIISYGRTTQTNSFFVPLYFEIANDGIFIPGTAAEIYLVTSSASNALTLPLTAVIEEQGKKYVYLQTGGESFEKREVQTGKSDGTQTEITSGLKGGERVVTKGAYQIKLSTATGELPAHGHEH